MLPVLSALLAFAVGLFRSRASLYLEHLALRHRFAVYQQTIHRPRLRATDRLCWAWLSRLWSGWQSALKWVGCIITMSGEQHDDIDAHLPDSSRR